MLYAWLYCLIILCKETNCISNILTNHPKSLGKGYLRLGNYLIKFCRQFLADAFLAFAYGGCGGVAKVVATDTTKQSAEGAKSQKHPLRSAWSLGNENLHAECAYAQLLHDGAVVLAAGTDEEHFLAKFLALYAGTAFVEQHLVVLVDGDEDTLAIFRNE